MDDIAEYLYIYDKFSSIENGISILDRSFETYISSHSHNQTVPLIVVWPYKFIQQK